MEKTKDNNLLETLKNAGVGEGEYKVTVTKEVRFERIDRKLSIETTLPYPIPDTQGTCTICNTPFAQHGYMRYFIEPLHVKNVRNFIIYLMEKLDATKNMPLKLAIDSPSSVLNPKEIVNTIFELLREAGDVNLANHYIRVVSHFTPAESIRYSVEIGRGSLTQKLFQIERHYESLCREWLVEKQVHEELDETFSEVEFMEKHRLEAGNDYFNIQSDFHLVTARILAYAKMAKQFVEKGPYDAMRRSIAKRAQRPTTPAFPFSPYMYDYPGASRRRRPPQR